MARRVAYETLGLGLSEDAGGGYTARLWGALQTHIAKRKLTPTSVAEIEDLIGRLEEGELHYGRVRENVVADVIVAYGLEQHENRAAETFQKDYMPIVRYHANRFAGQRGVDAVENLAADLVLPREGRPPKIATYRGLTPMKAWLRSVVVNRCVGAHRKQRETNLGDTASDTVAMATEDTVIGTAQATDCEQKLAPTFRDAVGKIPTEDRVLLKMLILDGVSQKALAKTHGVDSGTLTRRRQKAAGRLLQEIHTIGRSGEKSGPVNECLELLLAGNVADLQTRLATLLAAPFQDADAATGGP
ncbi:MAG: hypothetical protein AAF266_14620 [Planctomycetota bacterium]